MDRIPSGAQLLLPPVDTGGAMPHKKTPGGHTQALHMHYVRGQTEKQTETELAHLRFFASVARTLGLELEILTDQNSRKDVDQVLSNDQNRETQYRVIESHQPITKWAEDGVEYLENGKLAVLPSFDDQRLDWAMKAGRRTRWQSKLSPETLDEVLRDDHLWIPLGVRVNVNEIGVALEALAAAAGHTVGHIRAYIEGGNMIAGEDAIGQPILLIGKDAIDATAHLYQLTRDQVREIIREDFGLATCDQIICVEQPGQFHLDLGLLFIGKGVVVLNDSRVALQDAIEMVEAVPCLTTKAAAAKLRLQHELEEDAAKDLQAAGINVIRKKLEESATFNFFNGEFVTGKNGLNYYITNGGPPEQEQRFKALMVEEWKIVADVFFSPIAAAQKSLQELGGVGCRLKGIPSESLLRL
ncbi:hypothetical protein IQ267_17325 [filamentous cyanobacterium LEGE 07170]|nr:hypothetical protein [filamentous cyanobacterium LEGE 07170]